MPMRKRCGRWGPFPFRFRRGESPAGSGAGDYQDMHNPGPHTCRIVWRVPGGGQRLTQPRFPPFNKCLDFPPASANVPATQVNHVFITFHETLHEKLMSVSLADCAGRCCYNRHVLCTKSFCSQLPREHVLTRAWAYGT